MAQRPFYVSFGWTLRDYAKRVWDNSGEDNVLFLAGGIAFNIILAALPFVLLLATVVTWIVPHIYGGTINSSQQVAQFIDRLLPVPNGAPLRLAWPALRGHPGDPLRAGRHRE